MVKKNRNILRNKGKGIKLNQLLKLYKQCKHKHCPILMLHKKQHSVRVFTTDYYSIFYR